MVRFLIPDLLLSGHPENYLWQPRYGHGEELGFVQHEYDGCPRSVGNSFFQPRQTQAASETGRSSSSPNALRKGYFKELKAAVCFLPPMPWPNFCPIYR